MTLQVFHATGGLKKRIPCAVEMVEIITIPPGIRASLYFGYPGTCATSAAVEPGRGCRAKISAPGWLVLSRFPVAFQTVAASTSQRSKEGAPGK